MKIDIIIPDEDKKRIGVVDHVPEGKGWKLVGLNGVGKTLSAKLLCTIAGFPVWESKNQIQSLREYLPIYNVKITLNNPHKLEFLVHCDLSKWEYDIGENIIVSNSIGSVKKNGKKSDINELRTHFFCCLVKGNEDISKQIEFVTNSYVDRVENYFSRESENINIFYNYTSSLRNLLSEEDELEIIVSKKEHLEVLLKNEVKIDTDAVTYYLNLYRKLKEAKFSFSTKIPKFSRFKNDITTLVDLHRTEIQLF
jgi:hypothetical protein